MKTLLVSMADTQYDGRTRALIEIIKSFSDLHVISSTKGESFSEPGHDYIGISGKNGYARFCRATVEVGSRQEGVDCLFIDNRRAVIPGLKLRKKLKPRLTIYDARELYIRSEMKSLSGKIGCDIEKKMFRTADLVICCNEERRKIMIELYGGFIKDIFVFDNFRRLQYSQDADIETFKIKYKKLFKENVKKIVSTSGSDLGRNTLEAVITVSRLSQICSLYLVGCKPGYDTDVIMNYLDQHNVYNVHVLPMTVQDELKYIVSNCDIGLALYGKHDSNNLYCSSGKLYEYIYEGLPIITSDNPTLTDVTKKYIIGSSSFDLQSSIRDVCENYDYYKSNVEELIASDIVNREQTHFTEKLRRYIEDHL